MVELVIIACLAGQPARCETFREPFQAEMGQVQCEWHAQFRAAQWSAQHPGWTIRRFTCKPPEA